MPNNYKEQRVLLPLENLSMIGVYSFIETGQDIRIALSDKRRKLYILDVNEALKMSETAEFLDCKASDQ